jgi:hypothetical protein
MKTPNSLNIFMSIQTGTRSHKVVGRASLRSVGSTGRTHRLPSCHSQSHAGRPRYNAEVPKRVVYGIFSILIFLLSCVPLSAEVPGQIHYQGLLADEKGNPVNGNRTIEVRLFDAPEGGNILYHETIGPVTVVNGIYSFSFGNNATGIAAALSSSNDFLSVSVNSTEQTQRTKILAVPYALKAKESADAQGILIGTRKLPSGSVGSDQLAAGAVKAIHLEKAGVNSENLAAGSTAALKVVGGNVTADPNRTYFSSPNQPTVITLPSQAAIGDTVKVVGAGALVRAPEGVVIGRGDLWSPRKISFGNETVTEIREVICSDDAKTIYASVTVRGNEPPMEMKQGIAVSRDGAQTWTYQSMGNDPSQSPVLRGCSANGSRVLFTSGGVPKLLDNFEALLKEILLPSRKTSLDDARLTLDGQRVVAITGEDLFITDDLGVSWRTSPKKAGNVDFVFEAPSGGYPSWGLQVQVSENGSTILASARTTGENQSQVLVFSADGGNSWRILELPKQENGTPYQFSGMSPMVALSRDGRGIIAFAQSQFGSMQNIRLLSNDGGVTWIQDAVVYQFDQNYFSAPSYPEYLILSKSLSLVYYGDKQSVDSGRTWFSLPSWNSGPGMSFSPPVKAISSDGLMLLAAGQSPAEPDSGMLYTSWSEEIACSSEMELIYAGEGLWNAMQGR